MHSLLRNNSTKMQAKKTTHIRVPKLFANGSNTHNTGGICCVQKLPNKQMIKRVSLHVLYRKGAPPRIRAGISTLYQQKKTGLVGERPVGEAECVCRYPPLTRSNSPSETSQLPRPRDCPDDWILLDTRAEWWGWGVAGIRETVEKGAG